MNRLRRDGIAVATVVVSRPVGKARAYWCEWICEPHRVRRGVKSGIVDRAQQIVCFLEADAVGAPTPYCASGREHAVRLCTSCRRLWHLGQVAAFDPDPCTVDPDHGPSGAVLWQTQPRLQHERLAPFGK